MSVYKLMRIKMLMSFEALRRSCSVFEAFFIAIISTLSKLNEDLHKQNKIQIRSSALHSKLQKMKVKMVFSFNADKMEKLKMEKAN